MAGKRKQSLQTPVSGVFEEIATETVVTIAAGGGNFILVRKPRIESASIDGPLLLEPMANGSIRVWKRKSGATAPTDESPCDTTAIYNDHKWEWADNIQFTLKKTLYKTNDKGILQDNSPDKSGLRNLLSWNEIGKR